MKAATAIYPKTFAGLMTCYAAGVSFFRDTLEGGLLCAAVFGLPVATAALNRWTDKTQGTAAAAEWGI